MVGRGSHPLGPWRKRTFVAACVVIYAAGRASLTLLVRASWVNGFSRLCIISVGQKAKTFLRNSFPRGNPVAFFQCGAFLPVDRSTLHRLQYPSRLSMRAAFPR